MGPKASPADSPAGTPGLSGVDSPVNGTASRRNPFGGTQTSSAAVPSLPQLEHTRSMSGSVASPTTSTSAVVKNEDGQKSTSLIVNPMTTLTQGVQNGRPNSAHTNGSSMMPPSGNQSISGYGSHYGSSGQVQSYGQTAYPTPNPSFESKWRLPGKGMLHFLSFAMAVLNNLRCI